MPAKKKRLIVLLAILVLGATAFWTYKKNLSSEPKNEIRASGSVEATEILIAPKIQGRIMELPVDEGYTVRAGDLIAQLDTSELEAKVEAAQAALAQTTALWKNEVEGPRPQEIAQARAMLTEAESGSAGAELAVETSLEDMQKVTTLKQALDAAQARYLAAQDARKQSQAALKLVQEGTRSEQIAQARAALAQALVVQQRSESDYRRYKALYNQDAISALQYDAAAASRNASYTETAQARARLSDLVAGPRPQDVREAEMIEAQSSANLEGARSDLANARVAYQDRITARARYDASVTARRTALAQVQAAQQQLNLLLAGTRPQRIIAARDAARQAKANLAYAMSRLNDARIVSTVNGVVNTRIAEKGEEIAPNAPIVSIYDLDRAWVRVYVPETLYGRIMLGEHVKIRVDSYPKRSFDGRVASINSVAEFTPKSVQTSEERAQLVYGVKVDLNNRDHLLKPGMPADAYFPISAARR